MAVPKKVYACDTGIAHILEKDPEANLGHKLENVVFSHLKHRGGDLTYSLDDKERECDFVRFAESGEIEAVQVCWESTDDDRKREIDRLVSALKRFGLKKGIIVTNAQSDTAVSEGCEITIVPAFEYLTAK